jgi:hypothetical protein
MPIDRLLVQLHWVQSYWYRWYRCAGARTSAALLAGAAGDPIACGVIAPLD